MTDTSTAARFGNMDFGSDTITEVKINATDSAFGAEGGLMTSRKAGFDAEGVSRNALGYKSGSSEGHLHTHVAEQWMKTTVPLNDFVTEVNDAATGKEDINVKRSDFHIDDDLTLSAQGDNFTFTNGALESLAAGYTDIPPAMVSYLLGLGNQEKALAGYFNDALETTLLSRIDNMKNSERADAPLLVRYRTQENGSKIIRATKSAQYGVINNNDAINMVNDAIEHIIGTVAGVAVSHAVHNGDRFKANLLFPDTAKQTSESDYGTGVSIQNCELGSLTFKVMAFLYRAICMNGMVWNRRDAVLKVNKRHSGVIDFGKLALDTREAIELGLSDGESLFRIMEEAKDINITSIPMLVAYLSKTNGLTVKEGNAWNRQAVIYTAKYDKTAFSLVNALTAAAQEVDADGRGKMEELAATIMTPSLSASKDERVSGWKLAVQNANDYAAKNAKIVEKYQRITIG